MPDRIPVVLGYDSSTTSFGLCRGLTEPETVALKPPDRLLKGDVTSFLARLSWLRANVVEFANGSHTDQASALAGLLIMAESPSYGSVNKAHRLGAAYYGPLAELVAYGAWVVEVAPSQVKVFQAGGGRVWSKVDAVAEFAIRTGIGFATDDEADACALWCMGQEITGRPHPLEKHTTDVERSVLDRLHYPKGFPFR